MHAKIRDYTPADLESLRALISAPGMAAQFDKYQGEHGAERMLGDPYLHPGAVKMVFEDDEAAGFAITYLLPHGDASFAMNRIGVRESSRRKGLATALLAVAEHWALTQSHAPVAELAASAWAPEPAADALAARHGFVHDRWFWLMERPRGRAPEPRWPDGVTTRSWDGSVTMLDDAVAAYNDSFAEHYHFVVPRDRDVPTLDERFVHLLGVTEGSAAVVDDVGMAEVQIGREVASHGTRIAARLMVCARDSVLTTDSPS